MISMELRRWQQEALDLFEDNHKLFVAASTGTGKTFVAIKTIQKIQSIHPDTMTFIVVPTTNLMDQWYEELRKHGINAARKGGGRNGGGLKKVNIFVVNTACKMLPHIQVDNVLLVCDEAHRYFSPKFKLIFDTKYEWLLGLSATPPDDLGPFGDVCYEYKYQEAVDEGIVNQIEMFNVGYNLAPGERAEYEKFTQEKKNLERKLGVFSPSPELLNTIATKGDTAERRELAVQLRQLLFRRKRALYLHQTRIDLAVELVDKCISNGRKTLVLGESIPAANELAERLSAYIEHSEMPDDDRKRAIARFRDGKTNLLISVKGFQEGMNIPGIDGVVIMSSPGNERKIIQSMGRGARTSGKPWTAVYRIFARSTTDEIATVNLMASGVLGEDHIGVVDTEFQEIELSISVDEFKLKDRYQKGVRYSTSGNDFFRREKNVKIEYVTYMDNYRHLLSHDQWTGGRFVVEKDGTVLIKGKDKNYYELGPFPKPLKVERRVKRRSLTEPLSEEEHQYMMDFFDRFKKK